MDGYAIRRISQLKKVEIKDDKCNEINKEIGLVAKIKMPEVDITSWQTIFQSLNNLDTLIIIEDAIGERFTIGKIRKVFKNKILFHEFDADGIWSDDLLEIPYSAITCVKWDTRYSVTWEKYLKSKLSL